MSLNFVKMMKLLVLGVACFSSQVCAATIEEYNFSNAVVVSAGGPQWTQNHLSFTFDASQETNATGTFTAYVTFPDFVQIPLHGTIGAGGEPVVLQIGPPSLQGSYTLTFEINTLSGTINHTQGPFVQAKNLTTGSTANFTFDVMNVDDQSSTTFVNIN